MNVLINKARNLIGSILRVFNPIESNTSIVTVRVYVKQLSN